MNEAFVKKMIKVQADLKVPKGQINSFGKYSYRNLDDILMAVKPLLFKQGLLMTLSDQVYETKTRHYVIATCMVTDGTDTLITTGDSREQEQRKGMDESQITGSTSSYARKKALDGMFLLDDTKDADSMDNREQGTEQSEQPTRQPEPEPKPYDPRDYLDRINAQMERALEKGWGAEYIESHAIETWGTCEPLAMSKEALFEYGKYLKSLAEAEKE